MSLFVKFRQDTLTCHSPVSIAPSTIPGNDSWQNVTSATPVDIPDLAGRPCVPPIDASDLVGMSFFFSVPKDINDVREKIVKDLALVKKKLKTILL